MATIFAKDPDEVLDYGFDWAPWLEGDTIITSTWIVPAGITLNSSSNDVTSAIAWLSAGVAGARYTIVNRIATAGGRTAERVLYVDVRSNEVS